MYRKKSFLIDVIYVSVSVTLQQCNLIHPAVFITIKFLK